MPNLTIKGWDTGRNKILMIQILQKKLVLGLKNSKDIADAVSEGKKMTLHIEDAELASELAEELTEIGAKVEIESE
ncbi:MAG: ribosomal protein L7/L12 [Aridibacter sp.]